MNLVSHVVPDIPRIYTAIAEWSACLIYVLMLRKRFSNLRTGLIAAAFLLVQCIFMVTTGSVSLIFWIPCMLIAFGLMALMIWGLCYVNPREMIYYAMQAFVMAEFIASFFWQLYNFFAREMQETSIWMPIGIMLLVYVLTGWAIFSLMHSHLPKDGHLDLTGKDFYSAAIITVAVFAISNISFISSRTPFSSDYDFYIRNIRTLVDVGGMAILYAHFVQCCETKMRRELDVMQGILATQYQQYKYSRESVNLIHMKYHDLKHQIAVLRAESDADKRAAFLDQMEDEIRRYDLENKTGNAVLDTILTSKGMYCDKHGVTLTTVADGTILADISPMDIASIFGNALDNSLEYLLTIPDKEKRLIHVIVAKQKNFRLIQIENYFEGSLDLPKNPRGQLRSSKKDKDFHGYGIMSIRYCAEKYGGAVSVSAEDSWFRLKILLPE